jgi:hypothetical protein
MPWQVRQGCPNPTSGEASGALSVRRPLHPTAGQAPEAAVTTAGAGVSVATTVTTHTSVISQQCDAVNNAADHNIT